MDDKRSKQEKIGGQERRVFAGEQRVEFRKDVGPAPEKKESVYEKAVSEELKREIEMMELDDKTKSEAKRTAEKIEFLGEKDKIEHLLKIAEKKGLVFAIKVAKSMNDPYILDILHDILAKEGYYKNFTVK